MEINNERERERLRERERVEAYRRMVGLYIIVKRSEGIKVCGREREIS